LGVEHWPQFREMRGVSDALIAAVIEWAKQEGATQIQLDANSECRF
jgi:lysylphosphatidylglycerol synthetase-like protein (DUF2156 family)